MIKTFSTAALSLALAGSLSLSGLPTEEAANQTKNIETARHVLANPVSATPELVELAKAKGIDLSKSDPLKELLKNKGTKFQQAGEQGVTYKATGEEIPMLVLLVDFADEQPLGAPEERVSADKFDDLIFGDEYNPYELEQFKDYAVAEDGTPAPTDRTMNNIYKEASFGKAELKAFEGDSPADIEWITLDKPASAYLSQDNDYVLGNENGYAHMGELVTDLLVKADKKIDFSKYAVETEDGQVVPNVFIVHAGTGAEFSRDPAQIWSHKWDPESALYYGDYYRTGFAAPDTNEDGTVSDEEYALWVKENKTKWMPDGVAIETYAMQPEIGGNVTGYNGVDGYDETLKTGPFPAQPGVYAHEFGHALGLPDYYDTDYSSEGVGNYSMMSGGSWMRYPNEAAYSGNSPTDFDPFSKIFLGWSNPVEVTPEDEPQTITLQPSNLKDDVVKMEVPGSNGNEYFLFENIQQTGITNIGLNRQGEDSHGLVAWHVDETVISKYQTHGYRVNNVENTMNKRFQSKDEVNGITHYGLSVLQSDGNYDLENAANRGDSGDFFKTGDELTPNTKNVHTGSYYFWKGNSQTPADSGIHVTDIVENEDGTITATFYYSHDSKKVQE